ncbi:MAG: peptidylprolyl isomerase [Spirochaetales bacterium]|nr:peptidylprolyl isomerase [Spirochaetales bacterium]
MIKLFKIIVIVGLFFLLIAGCSSPKKWNLGDGIYAEIDTNKGPMVFRLYLAQAPLTVTNFVGLAEGTIKQPRNSGKFYDGLKFFSKKENLMIISGDPQGSGAYIPGYTIPDEFAAGLSHKGPGYLSMVNNGPNTSGSQIFITLSEASWLDNRNNLFGEIVEGQNVIPQLEVNDVIKTVKILRVGDQYKDYKVDQNTFSNMLKSAWSRVETNKMDTIRGQEEIISEKYPGALSTDSGLMTIVLKEGSGARPNEKNKVVITYSMSLLDGTILVSSADKGKSKELSFANMQKGLKEGLLLMKQGEKRILISPPQLAFGSAGVKGTIPENAYIIYEVTLEKIN